tara:strand:- start:82 stop:201 length:120 start_codon:yes stop_codon:yes gene_type:complete
MPYRAVLNAILGGICFLGGLGAIWALTVILWALTGPVPQ